MSKPPQVQVAAALAAASTKSSGTGDNPEQVENISAKIAQTVNSLTDYTFEISKSSILWVDDAQNNTIYERQALTLMGVKFTLSSTTDDALAKIKSSHFDLIISDMQRPGDNKAGYTLLEKLPENHPPYIIYRSSISHEDTSEAKQRGAVGITNKPEELFKMVLNILGRMNEPNWRSAISSQGVRSAKLFGSAR